MTDARRCEYCGAKGAKCRRPGEPPTCYLHADIPAIELKRERELDRLVGDLYEAAGRSARREPQPRRDG